MLKNSFILIILLFIFTACKNNESTKNTITIAFGSCNNQTLENTLWAEIKKNNPEIWIWGGDIIYSDTDDMTFLEKNYTVQKNKPEYKNFVQDIDVLGTWDDHDYGLNDGGKEYTQKEASQQLFLDFLDVAKDDPRREQEGVYFSKEYKVGKNNLKIIILDTRYFRTALAIDTISKKRYLPTLDSKADMLGDKQWKWLENELTNSKASFHIIMSSIQFLSAEHGFESWGNMPNEVEKFETILEKSKAKNVILLSGDRHISEISKKEVEGLAFPLIDFTSSGMTHSYTSYSGEPNKYRIVDVVFDKSFGILNINFENNTVEMEIRGEHNELLRSYTQKYF